MRVSLKQLLLMVLWLCVGLAALALEIPAGDGLAPKATKIEEVLDILSMLCAMFVPGISFGLAIGAIAGNTEIWCKLGVLAWPMVFIGLAWLTST